MQGLVDLDRVAGNLRSYIKSSSKCNARHKSETLDKTQSTESMNFIENVECVKDSVRLGREAIWIQNGLRDTRQDAEYRVDELHRERRVREG